MGISTFPSTTVTTGKKLKFNPSLISNSIQLTENETNRSATAYGNGMFVIARANRGIWTSTDGKNWKSIANNGPINTSYPSSLYWFDLVWNGSYWLGILSDGTLRKSTDLVNWTTPGSIGFTATSGAKLVYKSTGTATWLVVANNSTTLQHLAYSTNDGVTWTNSSSNYQTATSTTSGRTYSAVWDGTNFIVVAASGKIATSPDGANWTNRTNTFTTQNIYTVATNGTRVIAGTSSGNWAYSDDNGATWTANTAITSASPAIYSMIWDGSRFVFMDGVETNFYYSTTGIGTATAGTTFTAPSTLQSNYARAIATNGSGVIVYQSAAELTYTTDVTSGVLTNTSYNFASASSLDTTNSAKSNSRFIKDGNGKYWMFGSTTSTNGRPFVLTSDDKGATWSLSDNPWNKFDITTNARSGAFQIDFAGYVNNTLFTIPSTFNSSYYIKYSTDNGATATLTTPTSILTTAVVGLTHNGTYYVAANGSTLNAGAALQYSTTFAGPYTASDVSTVSATGAAIDLRSYGSLVTCMNSAGLYVIVSNDPTTFTSLTAIHVDSTGTVITPLNNAEVKLVPGPNGKIVYFGSAGTATTAEKAYIGQANLFPVVNPNGSTNGGIYFTEVKYNGLEAATFKQPIAAAAGMVCLYATYSEALGWVAVYKRNVASHTLYYVVTSPDGVNFTVNSPIDTGATSPNADYFGVLDDKLFMYSLHNTSNASIMIGTNGSDVVQIPL